MLTVLHASDLQCGRPYRPHAAEAFLRRAHEVRPDVVVVSGDLTQRAKKREYQAASALLQRLPDAPCVVTPGNHDVPLFRVWERAFAPHRNWKTFVSPELDTVTRVKGATVVALDSSAPHSAIVNGRLSRAQVEFAARAFRSTPGADVRILVVHHHFVPVPDGTDGRTIPRAAELLRAFEDMGVSFVLGGHVHQTHITTSSHVLGARDRPGVPLIACGTTTSWRGRGAEKALNSFNVVQVDHDRVVVVPHVLGEGRDTFEPREPVTLPLHSGDAAREAGMVGGW